MREVIIQKNDAGQRLDKYLAKYLREAPKSFLYKMLRKKNILLNGKKAEGNEKLEINDKVKFFLAEETIAKFSNLTIERKQHDLDIIYEDDHILLCNKPVGMLSQKAKEEDSSLVEYVINYLLETQFLEEEEGLRSFRPSICNRLDRNTSGIVVAGKSLAALQELSALFKERTLHKYYLCFVARVVKRPALIKGYLHKDEKCNKVEISHEPRKGSSLIETKYVPLANNGKETLLKVQLITGRSHQIRSHLASIGHPIIGDSKYGDQKYNAVFHKQYGLDHQLLHAYRLELPELTGTLSYLSHQVYTARLPFDFKTILEQEQIITDLSYEEN